MSCLHVIVLMLQKWSVILADVNDSYCVENVMLAVM